MLFDNLRDIDNTGAYANVSDSCSNNGDGNGNGNESGKCITAIGSIDIEIIHTINRTITDIATSCRSLNEGHHSPNNHQSLNDVGSPAMPTSPTLPMAQGEKEWERAIDNGLTWHCLVEYIKQLHVIQIGPLCLSVEKSEQGTPRSQERLCQTIFLLGQRDERMYVSLDVADDSHQAQSNPDEATLRGLIGLYAATAHGELTCRVSNQSYPVSALWPFSCDWGEVLDTIQCSHFLKRDISPSFVEWASRYFYELYFDYPSTLSESALHQVLVDPASNVEHVSCIQLSGNKVEYLTAALPQALKIRSLIIDLEDPSVAQVNDLIQALCGCQHLAALEVRLRSSIRTRSLFPLDSVVEFLLPLIGCGHLEEIVYNVDVNGAELRRIAADELERLKSEWTQVIIDAAKKNPQLRTINLDHTSVVDDTRYCIDTARVYSLLENRLDTLTVSRICRTLDSDDPTRLALLHLAIQRFGGCAHEYKRERLLGLLFNVVRGASHYVTHLSRLSGSADLESNIPNDLRS